MKQNLLYILFIAMLLQLLSSCSENEDFIDTIYDTETPYLSQVDKWIRENYIEPHNIEVLYRWKDIENTPDKNLVPPREDTIVPFLKVVKKVWINTYTDILGNDVMNPIFPKQLLLVGSSSYNSNGTETLGTAEGGKKVIMYSLDVFNPGNKANIKKYTRILHHEFCHILNQTKEYNIAFKQVTPSLYTSAWTNYSDASARSNGFITAYAMAEPGEDFAEMLAEYVTNTAEEWNSLINGISNTTARAAINSKLELVRTYLEESWNISFDELRDNVISALEAIENGNY